MLAGVAIFCVGSVVAALASNVDWLIAGRVIMGVGAAASEPGTLSIIRHVYPDRRPVPTRWACGQPCPASWPRAGHRRSAGRVLQLAGHLRFNLGFGVVAFVLAAVSVPESSDRQGRSIDVRGSCSALRSWRACRSR